MKRIIVDILLIIVFFLLQCTLFQGIAMANVVPNLLVVLTSSNGFMRGKKSGLLIGFFCGLLMDIFFGDMIGFYALIYMYIGYVNGFFNAIFYDEDIKLPMILIAGSDFVYGLVVYFFLFLLQNKTDFLYYLRHVIIPETIYTVVVTVVLYGMILYINKRLDPKGKRSDGTIVE